MYDVPSQIGRVAVVTGASNGLGKETARRLALAGATVVLAVRSRERGDRAVADIKRDAPDADLRVRIVDLASLASVASFASDYCDEFTTLDFLANNAGVMMPPKRIETVDGFEIQLGTNFLCHFALTMRLLPRLVETPASRVCTMSSVMANIGSLRYHDLQWERHYVGALAYAQSKLADLVFAMELARRLAAKGWDVTSNAAHPGYTHTNLIHAGTNMGRSVERVSLMERVGPLFGQSVEQGVEPFLYALTSPDATASAYYGPRWGMRGSTTLTRPGRQARRADGTKLWSVAARLTTTDLPAI